MCAASPRTTALPLTYLSIGSLISNGHENILSSGAFLRRTVSQARRQLWLEVDIPDKILYVGMESLEDIKQLLTTNSSASICDFAISSASRVHVVFHTGCEIVPGQVFRKHVYRSGESTFTEIRNDRYTLFMVPKKTKLRGLIFEQFCTCCAGCDISIGY